MKCQYAAPGASLRTLCGRRTESRMIISSASLTIKNTTQKNSIGHSTVRWYGQIFRKIRCDNVIIRLICANADLAEMPTQTEAKEQEL